MNSLTGLLTRVLRVCLFSSFRRDLCLFFMKLHSPPMPQIPLVSWRTLFLHRSPLLYSMNVFFSNESVLQANTLLTWNNLWPYAFFTHPQHTHTRSTSSSDSPLGYLHRSLFCLMSSKPHLCPVCWNPRSLGMSHWISHFDVLIGRWKNPILGPTFSPKLLLSAAPFQKHLSSTLSSCFL